LEGKLNTIIIKDCTPVLKTKHRIFSQKTLLNFNNIGLEDSGLDISWFLCLS